MSTNSPQDQVEFDFWEFVSCAKCRMPFALDNGAATVPFWLTECGHVVCNSHLNPDQSCSQCGSRDIQLAPLQRQMEAPMSQWFQSIPQALDAVAFAAKFQQEALASQLRHYRSRQEQYRLLVDRLKRDISELKKENEALRRENEQYQLYLHHQGRDAQYVINANGKRQIVSVEQPGTGSSTRSINIPLAPTRLTLQPDQQVPELNNQGSDSNSRPVSTRSLEQYTYKPPENRRLATPTLTHAQVGPRIFQHGHIQMAHQETQITSNSRIMPPPPSRFKPALGMPSASSSNTNSTAHLARRPTNMAPPQTPQHDPVPPSSNPSRFRDPLNGSNLPPPFIRPPTGLLSISHPPANTTASQRFFPSRTDVANSLNNRSGQRMPFVPDGQQKR